jgi:hypothetical protein
MLRMKEWPLGLLVFLVTWWIFYGSPVHYLSDGQFSLLMDEAILHHGTPDMIAYQVPRGRGPGFSDGYPWQLVMLNGRLLYTFPWGAAFLSVPAVAALNAAGFETAPNHVYNAAKETQMQGVLSAFLCAITIWLFYRTAKVLAPGAPSAIIALVAAFGTQMWSSSSRTLWPQTWYLVLISCVIFLLVNERIRPVLLATILAWACFVRPVALPTALLVGVYVLLECKTHWLQVVFVLNGIFWTIIFALLMSFFLGRMLPPTLQLQLFTLRGFFTRLQSVLFSPSRGLVIYMPIVWIPLYLTVRYWRVLPKHRLAVLAIAVIVSTVAVFASYTIWWGGWSYGPRDLGDIVPWLVLLAILGMRAFLDDPRLTMHECSAVISAGILLVAISVAMNAPGALSHSALSWNAVPNVDEHPERLWDWQHPQWLAWAQSR